MEEIFFMHMHHLMSFPSSQGVTYVHLLMASRILIISLFLSNAYEYLEEINPSNLSWIITEEKQLLKQLQEDNDVHRKDYLDAIYERLAAEKSVDKAIIVKEMNIGKNNAVLGKRLCMSSQSLIARESRDLGFPRDMNILQQ